MKFIKKWNTYQKERFPILTFGLYVLTIVIAVFCFCNNINQVFVSYLTVIPMFIVTFLQFLMIRIVDEFKDYKEDCKYRPYRPVPRGLVSLKELKVLLVICLIIQTTITYFTTPYGMVYLIILWIYFFIMSKGYFIKKFLDKHILFEVLLDEIMMPIMVMFLASFIFKGFYNLNNILNMLILSYLVSWIVEIARKTRCEEDEENGVKTYTAVLGINKTMLLLAFLETLLMIVQFIILGMNYIIFIVVAFIITNIINILFVIKKDKKCAKLVELFANLYIIVVYLSMILLII